VSGNVNASERVALSRELGEFLIEFSIALHRSAMYPAGHPALKQAATQVVQHVATLLYDHPQLSIGVARRQLVIEGVATDPRNPVLRALAERLHRHHIGVVVFERGVVAEEILGALTVLAEEPERQGLPLGLREPERLKVWERVRLLPMTYEQLELLEGGGEEDEEEDGEGGGRKVARLSQLWIGLARAALASDETGVEPESTDPVFVAHAMNRHPQAQAYDQVIVGYLIQIAEQLRTERSGAAAAALRRRMSRLVGSLSEPTLNRLVEMGGDLGQREKFLLDATEGLAVDAVVEIVRAGATTSKQTISSSMLRLLSKLSSVAENGTGAVRGEADLALREQVRELIRDWSLKDPNPEMYTVALESMSKRTRGVTAVTGTQHEPESLRIIAMALELGAVGPSFRSAVEGVLKGRNLKVLVDMAASSPADNPPAALLWERLAAKENVLELLRGEPVDVVTLNSILDHASTEALPGVLLDALTDAESRGARMTLLERLVQLGPAVGHLIVRRLADDRWYVQRNMLWLLNEIGCPEKFSPAPFLRHPQAAVRREALRLSMKIPHERDRAVCLALADRDGLAFRVGVRAVESSGIPDAALPLVVNRVADEGLPSELRAPLVRALRGIRSPLALECLLRLVVLGRTLLGRPKLRPKSAELLAALSTLADTWGAEARVRALLARAKVSIDFEIRAAAIAGPDRR
jgi:hypothetical protein